MAAGTPVFPGPLNTYVPSHESTQGLIVDFSRNPSDFALNEYIKVIPVDKMTGYYARFGEAGGLPTEAARVHQSGLENFVWGDGNDAPDGKKTAEKFAYVQYLCIRYGFPWLLGDLLAEQASWKIKDQYSRMTAAQAMVARTVNVLALLQGTGNHLTTHYATVSAITGNTGTWDASTTARLDIRRSIDYAVNTIQLDTLGVVKREDLVLVMSPTCAQKTGRSQEIIDYLKQQSNSYRVITGDQWELKNFQFPSELHGVKVKIEDAVKATNVKGATRAVSYCCSDAAPFVVARPGSLVGTDAAAPNFSTATIFVYDKNEMLVETFHDDKHKRIEGRVIDNYATEMTAPATAFLFQSAVA